MYMYTFHWFHFMFICIFCYFKNEITVGRNTSLPVNLQLRQYFTLVKIKNIVKMVINICLFFVIKKKNTYVHYTFSLIGINFFYKCPELSLSSISLRTFGHINETNYSLLEHFSHHWCHFMSNLILGNATNY